MPAKIQTAANLSQNAQTESTTKGRYCYVPICFL